MYDVMAGITAIVSAVIGPRISVLHSYYQGSYTHVPYLHEPGFNLIFCCVVTFMAVKILCVDRYVILWLSFLHQTLL